MSCIALAAHLKPGKHARGSGVSSVHMVQHVAGSQTGVDPPRQDGLSEQHENADSPVPADKLRRSAITQPCSMLACLQGHLTAACQPTKVTTAAARRLGQA